MDLGVYPETKAAGPLLGLWPSLALSRTHWGAGGLEGDGKDTGVGGEGMAFLLQAVRLPEPTSWAWSLPGQDLGDFGLWVLPGKSVSPAGSP